MEKYESLRQKVKNFPDSPGVYLMKDKSGKIIYIGKAVSLKKRVSSYFRGALDNKTARLVSEVEEISYKETDTVVEALILEANLIDRYKPKYNVRLKDDKSFVNIVITDEEYPRVLIERPTSKKRIKAKYIFGPYPTKQEAEKARDLLVKIFDIPQGKFSTSDLYRRYYIKGYSSGKVGDITRRDYLKIINNIKLFLEGRKEKIIKKLEKEMWAEAEKANFENAAAARDQIFALRHIRDVAFIKSEDVLNRSDGRLPVRAEAYDISNIFGKFAVGSMVVFSFGKPDKDEYRRFKIKNVEEANDIAMLKEVLNRRFNHTDWKMPQLIVIDGGIGQKNAAKIILKKHNLDIPIVAIAKGPKRKGEKLFFSAPKEYVFPDIEFIKKMRDEAHRFAISYHRELRKKFSDSK